MCSEFINKLRSEGRSHVGRAQQARYQHEMPQLGRPKSRKVQCGPFSYSASHRSALPNRHGMHEIAKLGRECFGAAFIGVERQCLLTIHPCNGTRSYSRASHLNHLAISYGRREEMRRKWGWKEEEGSGSIDW